MMTYHSKNWAPVLKRHRESQELSLLELSNRTGISRNTLIALEKGSKKIQFKTKEKLEKYFVSFMLDEKSKENPIAETKAYYFRNGVALRVIKT